MKGKGWTFLGGKSGMRRDQTAKSETRRCQLIGRECLLGKWKQGNS